MTLWTPIPGETPIDDISGLKIKGITTRKELSFFEIENLRRAQYKYFTKRPTRRSAPFDLSWALRLHKEMLGDVWDWAGSFRHTDKNIGDHWEHVETKLENLLNDLAYWHEHATMPMLDQAVVLHHRAVSIHPFENGNGRWSRLLANIWLAQHDHPLTAWPEDHVGGESTIRMEYIDCLHKADAGDLGPLTELHRRYTPPSPFGPLAAGPPRSPRRLEGS